MNDTSPATTRPKPIIPMCELEPLCGRERSGSPQAKSQANEVSRGNPINAQAAEQAASKWRQCEHLFTADRRCGSPAMRGTHFCYYHRQNRRPRGLEFIPDLTSHRNIQRALSNTLRALASGRLTYEEGGRILYGITLAMNSVKASRSLVAPDRARSRSDLQSQGDTA